MASESKEAPVENLEGGDRKKLSIPDGLELTPTIFSDTFFLSYWKGHVKISFGEELEEKGDIWRSSVLLQERTVRRLVQNLKEILEEFDQKKIDRADPKASGK